VRYKIFNNQILVPLKCGSTYMEMVYPNDIIELGSYELSYIKDISVIVLREPLEHLQSALHTELLGWYSLNPEKSLSVDTATPLVKKFINTDLNVGGTTHWDVNYYEHLYKFWKRNRNTIKIIKVSDLSPFLKENYNVDLVHDKFSYGIPAHGGQFKYAFTTKQKLTKWIEETLPDMWNDLIRDIPKANKFYHLMINGEISEIYELEEKNAELEAQIIELTNKIDELEKWKFDMTLRTKKQLI